MTRKPILSAFAIAVSAIAIGACSKQDDAVANAAAANAVAANDMGAGNAMAGAPASFGFVGPTGQPLGTVAISEDPAGLTMTVVATGLRPGVHGIHLHEKGLCEGPKFESAGGHWNPGHKQHGRDNPAGSHAGDLVNLTVDGNGSATTTIPIAGARLSPGPMTLADLDGTALVIHAKADDYKTDPSGASGDRIACAVVAAPR